MAEKSAAVVITPSQQAEIDRGKAIKEKALKNQKDMDSWKPTPTQEENDLAALGQQVMDKEPDGSPEEGTAPDPQTRHLEGARGRGYETRGGPQSKTQPQPQPQSGPSHGASHGTGHS